MPSKASLALSHLFPICSPHSTKTQSQIICFTDTSIGWLDYHANKILTLAKVVVVLVGVVVLRFIHHLLLLHLILHPVKHRLHLLLG